MLPAVFLDAAVQDQLSLEAGMYGHNDGGVRIYMLHHKRRNRMVGMDQIILLGQSELTPPNIVLIRLYVFIDSGIACIFAPIQLLLSLCREFV
jgi:hypothetical protein